MQWGLSNRLDTLDRWSGSGIRRGLFENDMGIRAAQAKGTDTGEGLRCRPGRGGQRNLDWGGSPINQRAWLVKVKMWWDLAVMHRQRDFDQRDYAGGPFQMAHISLHRTDP